MQNSFGPGLIKVFGVLLLFFLCTPLLFWTFERMADQRARNQMRMEEWTKVRGYFGQLVQVQLRLKHLCAQPKTIETTREIKEQASARLSALEILFDHAVSSNVLSQYYKSEKDRTDFCSSDMLDGQRLRVTYDQIAAPVFLKLYGKTA